MARKKAKNSGGTGILIIFALAFSALAAIPKNAWIAIGVIAGIGTIMWLLAERGKRRLNQLQESAAKNIRPQKPQGLGKHRVEYRDFDIQLEQRSKAINGFSKVHGFGIEIDFFDFGIGSHHGVLAPERIESTASEIS